MQLLPVIDLQDGQVVRAVAGERAAYRPIRSLLTASSEPAAVAAALLDLARFRGLYIADLAAITEHGSDRHFDLLARLAADIGGRGVGELWLDAGRAPWLAALATATRRHGVRLVPVIGAESLQDGESPRRLDWLGADEEAVLSLDYRGGRFLGPRGLDRQPGAWPRRVIVMELAAVGVGKGPALARLQHLAGLARRAGRPDIRFHAAGGVRDAADLRLLAAHGVAGALIASALHDGRLDAATLREFVGAP